VHAKLCGKVYGYESGCAEAFGDIESWAVGIIGQRWLYASLQTLQGPATNASTGSDVEIEVHIGDPVGLRRRRIKRVALRLIRDRNGEDTPLFGGKKKLRLRHVQMPSTLGFRLAPCILLL
jgi:hypothetical protein